MFSDLEENYKAQLEHYRKLGWLIKDEIKEGIVDMFGTFRPVPSLAQVKEALNEKMDLLKYKATQGFTRFLLVPVGLSYVQMYQKVGEEYKRYHADPELGLYCTDSDKKKKIRKEVGGVLFNKCLKGVFLDNFLNELKEEDCYYYPETVKVFSWDSTSVHKGKTKKELIASQRFQGWEVHILQERALLPRTGEGQTIGDRPDLEPNTEFLDFPRLLRGEGELVYQDQEPIQDKEVQNVYHGESGAIPELWATLAFDVLRMEKRVLHDMRPRKHAGAILGGLLLKHGFAVSYFERDYGCVHLVDRGPGYKLDFYSLLSSVKVC